MIIKPIIYSPFTLLNSLQYDGTNDATYTTQTALYKNISTFDVSLFCNLTYRDTKSEIMVCWYSVTTPTQNETMIATKYINSTTFNFQLIMRRATTTYSYLITNNAFNYGTPYHLCVTFNSGTGNIYVNGINQSCTAINALPSTTFNYNSTIYIGEYKAAGGYGTKGKLTHIGLRHGRTVLTNSEVLQLYNNGVGSHYEEVSIFDTIWKFGEGTGTSIADSGLDGLTLTLADSPATPTWTTW